MQLFYNPEVDNDTLQITFDKIESRHIVKVLRKKEGDEIYITNGKGDVYTSKINIASDKKCLASIFSKEKKQKTRKYYLHLAIAPTKNMERFEWFLEKATEIGIDEITPIICDNSERKVIKTERLEKILVAAMKQSLQYHLPKLNDVITFKEFVQQETKLTKCIAHCYKSPKKSLNKIVKPKESTLIAIGPEGDFSKSEVSLAKKQNFHTISLGKNRLRTETAALASVQSIAFLNQ